MPLFHIIFRFNFFVKFITKFYRKELPYFDEYTIFLVLIFYFVYVYYVIRILYLISKSNNKIELPINQKNWQKLNT